MSDIDIWRKVAEAATPGPWEVVWGAVAYVDTVADPSDPTGQTPMQEPYKVADAGERDREFIATFDPPTVLDILDRLEGAEARAAELMSTLERTAADLEAALTW